MHTIHVRHGQTYDFCIVGTGPGGGIVAYLLAKQGFSVLSQEQGPRIDDS